MTEMCNGCRKVTAANMEDNPLELISEITQMNDIHEFMNDEDVDRAMHLVVKLLMNKGAMPPQQAAKLIVELQALATKFAIFATYYASIGKSGSEENHKKNLYFTLKDAITKLTDAIKYTAKADYS